MKFKKRPDTGTRVESEEVMRILASSTTDLLHLTLLDLKLSKMNLQRVTNQSQVVMVCPQNDEQDSHNLKRSHNGSPQKAPTDH